MVCTHEEVVCDRTNGRHTQLRFGPPHCRTNRLWVAITRCTEERQSCKFGSRISFSLLEENKLQEHSWRNPRKHSSKPEGPPRKRCGHLADHAHSSGVCTVICEVILGSSSLSCARLSRSICDREDTYLSLCSDSR